MAVGAPHYSFASVYKFNKEGVRELTHSFKSTELSRGAVCDYDYEADIFHLELDNCLPEVRDKIFNSFLALVTKYISTETAEYGDGEGARVQRIEHTRPDQPSGLFDDTDEEDEEPEYRTLGNLNPTCKRTWRPKQGDLPASIQAQGKSLLALSNRTNCSLVIDIEKNEVRIEGAHLSDVEVALSILSKIENDIYLRLRPPTSHLLQVDEDSDFRLQFFRLSQLENWLVRCTLLPDQSQDAEKLERRLMVRMLRYNEDTGRHEFEKLFIRPIQLSQEISYLRSIWTGFEYNSHGSEMNLPETKEVVSPKLRVTHLGQNMSREKALQVGKWLSEGPELEAPISALSLAPSIGNSKGVAKTDDEPRSSSLGPGSTPIAAPPPPAIPPPDLQRKPFGKKRVIKGSKKVDEIAESTAVSGRESGSLFETEIADSIETPAVLSQHTGADQPASQNFSWVLPRFPVPDEQAQRPKTLEINKPKSRQAASEVLSRVSVSASAPQPWQPDEREWGDFLGQRSAHGGLIDVSARVNERKAPAIPPGYEPRPPVETSNNQDEESPLIDLIGEQGTSQSSGGMPPSTPLPSFYNAPLIPRIVTTRQLRIRNGSISKTASTSSQTRSAKPVTGKMQAQAEADSREYERTMGQKKAAGDSEGKHESGSAMSGILSQAAIRVLRLAQSFSGEILLRVEVGRIFVHSMPSKYRKSAFVVDEWDGIFSGGHGFKAPHDSFTNRVTTAFEDAEFISELKSSDGEKMFHEKPYGTKVFYEFFCSDKDGKQIYIKSDDSLVSKIRTPPEALGKIYWHFPKRTWDARFSVTGLSRATAECEEAAERILENVFIPPHRSIFELYTHIAVNGLHVETACIRRETHFKSASHPDISLQLTEVQDVHIYRHPSGNGVLRLAAKTAPEMIRNQQLWYEVCLTSSIASVKFQENEALEVGRDATWQPREFVEEKVFENLEAVTREMVDRIDGVGLRNQGPRGFASASQAGVGGGDKYW
ncbi:MAG: hypothetical protein M1819_004601 [Sarea resinae]|nr:MAG: hypothetical protein M1819_004601 [Sarea resinae]